MEITLDISNDPRTELKRRVTVDTNLIDWMGESTEVNYIVSYWANNSGSYGDKISGSSILDPNNRLGEYSVIIRANDNMVNPLNMDEMPKRYFDLLGNEVNFDDPLVERGEYVEGGVKEFLLYAHTKGSDIGLTDPSFYDMFLAMYNIITARSDSKGSFN